MRADPVKKLIYAAWNAGYRLSEALGIYHLNNLNDGRQVWLGTTTDLHEVATIIQEAAK